MITQKQIYHFFQENTSCLKFTKLEKNLFHLKLDKKNDKTNNSEEM